MPRMGCSRRFALRLGLACCAALPLACGDAVPSEEDLIERFIQEVTGPVDSQLVERAISYTQLDALPIDVRALHFAGVYDASRADELLRAFREGMARRFYGTELDVRSKQITIEGSRAHVKLALMSGVGPLRVDLGLQRLAAGWKVTRVHVDR
jgi:hypothetical protein